MHPGAYIIRGCMCEDIRKIKDSLEKYQELLSKEETVKSDRWYSLLDKTEWPSHIQSAINTANLVLRSLKARKTVLVHSELGRDRTPLVVALALLFFDPFYRTMKGFEALVEKEFLSFGHQFKTRLAHCQENGTTRKSYAPVFVLFLDSVYQAMVQVPSAFEFNQRFLRKLATHVHTLKFGTFLNDSEGERVAEKTYSNTTSIWSYIEHYKKREKYLNNLYDREGALGPLNVDPIASRFVVWNGFYLKWHLPTAVPREEYPNEM